ncbi:Kelch repeat-containing protein [Yeosuana marina]|uniref:Kelch repeat-containing protein n=1 Tax=Yeosuana marina TaxID=1565536 RepID=UPI00141ED970|nr:kelch repeat-containing protein [Yeosuana marina]
MKLTYILLLSSCLLVGQNIKGTILDLETNLPIENVTVFYQKDNTGTVSNKDGEFKISVESKIKASDTLQFSKIGYTTKKVTIASLKDTNYKVFLKTKIEELDEIKLNVRIKLNSKLPFKTLTSLKKGLYGFGSSLIDNKLYVIGGDQSFLEDIWKKAVLRSPSSSLADLIDALASNMSWENYSEKLQIYNIDEDTWSTSNLKFDKRAYHNINYFNNKLYVFGGKTLSANRKKEYLDDKIEVFDVNTQQIIVDNTNPHQAINFASFTYKDNIIVMGGSIKLKNNGEKVYTDASHMYNITSGYWYELHKMTKPKEVNGVLINDKIYLIGGFNEKPLTEIESYDLATGKWQKEGDLFHGIENPALTHYDNTIYIFNDGEMLTYNTITKTLNEYKIDLYLKNSQLQYYNNNLYIIGGYTKDEFEKSPSSSLYSINVNDFLRTKINNSKKLIKQKKPLKESSLNGF